VVPFTSLSLVKPAPGVAVNSETNVAIEAEMVPGDFGVPIEGPQTIVLNVRRGETPAGEITLERKSAGKYVGTWRAAVDEGTYGLVAEWKGTSLKSLSVAVSVDNTAPRFELALAPRSLPPTEPGLIVSDPNGPENSRPYGEELVVQVRTDDKNPKDDGVVVVASMGGASVRANVQRVGNCNTPFTFCGEARLQPWRLPLNDFRGSMTLHADGTDAAGNAVSGAAAQPVPVTRFKWERTIGGKITGAPAVGGRGTLYVGNDAGATTGAFFALKPDGTSQWRNAVNLGSVRGSPAVGAYGNEGETVFVAGKSEAGLGLYALAGQTGAVLNQGGRVGAPLAGCTFPNGTNPNASAILTDEVAETQVETGLFVLDDPRTAVGVRRLSSGWECVPSNSGLNSAVPANSGGATGLAVQGLSFFYGTAGLKVVGYSFGARNSRFLSSALPALVFGVALSESNVVVGASGQAGGVGGLYVVPIVDSPTEVAPSAVSAGVRVAHLALRAASPAPVAYFGAETDESPQFWRHAVTPMTTPVTRPAPGLMSEAPVIGQGGLVYTVVSSGGGRLAVWDAESMTERWNHIVGDATASPTLDCARDAAGEKVHGPGTLYVPLGGKLLAVSVDSRGLDTTAPWPKYQRDPRNTGNADTDLSQFTCPQ
jgi:outer membrane protein assembly factor BamB